MKASEVIHFHIVKMGLAKGLHEYNEKAIGTSMGKYDIKDVVFHGVCSTAMAVTKGCFTM